MALPAGGGNIDGGRLIGEFGGFINESVPEDRKVDARLMNTVFTSLYQGAGVLERNRDGLEITASSPAGMTVNVGAGYALLGTPDLLTPYLRISAIDIGIQPSNTQARIDLVVAYMNLEVSNRFLTVATIEGTPAGSPIAPDVDDFADQNSVEFALALGEIEVAANASSISDSNITDVRVFTDTRTDVGDGDVDTEGFVDRAVTEPKMADDSVSLRAMGVNSVGQTEMRDDAIGPNELSIDALRVVTTLPASPVVGAVWLYVGSTFRVVGEWDAGFAVPAGDGLPRGVAVKSNGDIVIVGSATRRVYTYSSGAWDAGFATPAAEPNPTGLAVKSNGDIVIVGSATRRVYTYSSGAWDAGFATPAAEPNPVGVGVKPNGDIVITGYITDRVYTYSSGVWNDGIDIPTAETFPQGVAVKPNGDIVIVGLTTDRVYTYSSGVWDAGFALPAGNRPALAIALKSNGDFMITEDNTHLVRTFEFVNPTYPDRHGVVYWSGDRWIEL